MELYDSIKSTKMDKCILVHDKFDEIADNFGDKPEIARKEAESYIKTLLETSYTDDVEEIHVLKTILIRTKGTKNVDNEVGRIREEVLSRYEFLLKNFN